MSPSNYCNLHSGQGKLLGWVIQLANIYRFCNCIWLRDFLILGKLCVFTDRAVFLKGRPRQVYMSVFVSHQFVLFGPAFLQNFPRDPNTFFKIHSVACNEKEPGHLLFEHLLAESKTHLSWAHMGWEYFLRISGAAKRGSLCIEEVGIDLNSSWFLAEYCNILGYNSCTDHVFHIWEQVNSFR